MLRVEVWSKLEFLSLSGTQVSLSAVRHVQRTRALKAAMPTAPKTVMRSNAVAQRALQWSGAQRGHQGCTLCGVRPCEHGAFGGSGSSWDTRGLHGFCTQLATGDA